MANGYPAETVLTVNVRLTLCHEIFNRIFRILGPIFLEKLAISRLELKDEKERKNKL